MTHLRETSLLLTIAEPADACQWFGMKFVLCEPGDILVACWSAAPSYTVKLERLTNILTEFNMSQDLRYALIAVVLIVAFLVGFCSLLLL